MGLEKIKIFKKDPIWVFSAQGEILRKPMESWITFTPMNFMKSQTQESPHFSILPQGILAYQDFHIIPGEPFLRIAASVSSELLFQDIRRLGRFFIIVLLIATLIIFCVAFYFSRSLSKPITELSQATAKIADGDLSVKVDTPSTTELQMLVDSFNQMADNLKKTTVSKDELEKEVIDRKKAEEELKNALTIKDEFTSIVSHELRTPLSISKEALSLFLRGKLGLITKKQREIMTMASTNIDRLSYLINDLLDVSKIEDGKLVLYLEPTDITNFVKETCMGWELKADARQIDFRLKFSNPSLIFPVDKLRFSQILTNLISNAIKFTPNHGKITVSVVDKEKAVEFSVIDTGIGIAKEDQKKLFQKFQQINRSYYDNVTQGTGLGLNIVKSLVELHGGQIQVESEVGQGASFIFTIPKITAI